MKKIVYSVIAACSLFALFSCNHRAETDTVQPAAMEELKPMQQSWRGVLPCADCEGIDTSLFPRKKDGTWVMNEHYQGARREPSSFASYGTWARTADKLVLTNSKGEKSYFRAKGDKLEMLDRNGSPIQSPLNAYPGASEGQPADDADGDARHVFLYGRCGNLYRLCDR
ncbi:copper resistance protein NlpE N-terminal domain-containing protein [Klebsiella pneumoniae subsp. pneumoniae]|nr:copper resistance protein NlpE N-terminal domain-containing protein [Klebsiella pneumoniae subsp. pneumoniae]